MIAALFSCTGSDNDDYTYSSDCYISSMTLGTMRRTVNTTTSDGKDTSYVVSVNGTYYPLKIDQRRQTITSATPLPMGTRISAVLVTVSFEGALVYAPEADTTAWTAYSSRDSLDFSSPLIFRVYAADGSGYRDYTATLTVLDSDPDAYTWTSMTDAPMLAGRSSTKMAMLNGKLIAMSLDAEGNAYMAEKADDDTWTERPCTGISNAEPRTLQVFGNQLWASTTDGVLMHSADGIDWQKAENQPATAVTLMAASETALYAAATTGKTSAFSNLYASADGAAWTPVAVEDNNFELFPTQQTASVAYTQTNGHKRVLIAGLTADAALTTVWNLREQSGEPWVLFSQNGDSNYTLNAEASMNIVAYNGLLFAIGTTTYISYDNGITWHSGENINAPAELQQSSEAIAATTDGNRIWVSAGSKVWKGMLNSLAD